MTWRTLGETTAPLRPDGTPSFEILVGWDPGMRSFFLNIQDRINSPLRDENGYLYSAGQRGELPTWADFEGVLNRLAVKGWLIWPLDQDFVEVMRDDRARNLASNEQDSYEVEKRQFERLAGRPVRPWRADNLEPQWYREFGQEHWCNNPECTWLNIYERHATKGWSMGVFSLPAWIDTMGFEFNVPQEAGVFPRLEVVDTHLSEEELQFFADDNVAIGCLNWRQWVHIKSMLTYMRAEGSQAHVFLCDGSCGHLEPVVVSVSMVQVPKPKLRDRLHLPV